jgi:hypothetical protein
MSTLKFRSDQTNGVTNHQSQKREIKSQQDTTTEVYLTIFNHQFGDYNPNTLHLISSIGSCSPGELPVHDRQ